MSIPKYLKETPSVSKFIFTKPIKNYFNFVRFTLKEKPTTSNVITYGECDHISPRMSYKLNFVS